MNQLTAEQMRPFEETFDVLSDPAIRRLGRQDPMAMLAEMRARGIEHGVADDVEVKAVFSTADKLYLAIPEFNDQPLDEADLQAVQGGNNNTVSTAACASSAGSVGSFTSTISSASTAGSLGSAGSAGTP